MDIIPQENSTQPISDDQDLAKALAGVSLDEPEETSAADSSDLTASLDSIEASDAASLPPVNTLQPEDASGPAVPPVAPANAPSPQPVFSMPTPNAAPSAPFGAAAATPAAGASDLDSIKSQAINQLRPLMEKVELPAEEKFDTYLMLIRSTDDAALIAPAHAAAQSITDEKRKAEALLEVIKEIDYLSKKGA